MPRKGLKASIYLRNSPPNTAVKQTLTDDPCRLSDLPKHTLCRTAWWLPRPGPQFSHRQYQPCTGCNVILAKTKQHGPKGLRQGGVATLNWAWTQPLSPTHLVTRSSALPEGPRQLLPEGSVGPQPSQEPELTSLSFSRCQASCL